MARHSMLALLGLSQFYVFALVGGSIVMDDLYTTIQPSTGIYDDFDHGDDTICSVWGTGHLLTFDHASMDLPLSSCSLSLVSITGSPSLSVSFQRRALDRMSVENVVVTMEGISLSLTREGQSISGQRVQLPYKDHSIQIEMVGSYIKCSSIMGFSLLWDQNNAITVKLDPKFHTKTTGLCGDFNGIADDFYFNGDLRSESDYTLMNKLNSLELCSQEPQQTNSYLSREYCLNKTQHIEHLLQDELLSCLSVMDHQLKFLLINILLSDICRLDCNGTAGLYPCDGCATIAEFSRRCTQANGSPGMWRSPEFCGVTCPRGQVHRECGSVCKDTCSNPSASVNCPSTCVDGCFCPEGMVWDDVSGSGCIPQSNCGCNQLGHSYASGESLITGCKNCTCEQGQWNCDSRPCYGTCKILGGSYFSTFDSKTYRFHGDCFYTLTTVVFKASGDVLVHENKVPLPFVSASVTVVQESSFYLRAETNFGLRLRVQLKPLMQLYITAATAYHNKTCGLCGNFNEVTGDDFTHSGIVDATAATFCNVWKAQATCPDREEVTMDPCSVYITNNEYAKTHCGLLMDNDGPFSTCHSVVSADEYYMRCKYDTCSCSYPEPCLCAALSAYAYACAANGVVLVGWRSDICSLDAENCPISHEFSYAAPECGSASCRASREVCRGVRPPPFELPSPSPVEGCVCGAGLYDDEHGVCVLKSDCPCYSEMSGDVIRAGVTVDLHDTQCLCTGGELHCFGLSPISGNTCEDPMTYHNCSDGSSEGSAACQRTCANPHSICYSPGCVSGCVCPGGLLVDHNGNCVSEEQCTCEHNGRHYNPGDTITQLCNKCTCMNARWSCTSKVCQGLCFVYGEGHHTTFDGKQYVFDGSCQYILSQDSCGNSSGSFRITTENEPCGTTGTTCSKKVHFFVGADELVLTDGTVMGSSLDLPGSPFHVRRMGIYTVVETSLGVTVIWDGHTAVSVHVDPQLKGRVCGLCGDYDGKVANDFVTRTGSVAASAPEFAAGWKESGSGCPDLSRVSDPCTINHHRESWAHKQCSVLKDGVFKQCHNMVEYLPYYTACVRDSCGCDTGGDCHCLCTSLASYAQACGSAGVCLRWRTPDLCPLGCDLYNKDEDQCEWHYRECGRGCQRSCTNRNAICTANLPPLEGCYPTCPSDRPFLNESSMTCVEQCDCVSNGTTYKANDRIPSNNSCEIWEVQQRPVERLSLAKRCPSFLCSHGRCLEYDHVSKPRTTNKNTNHNNTLPIPALRHPQEQLNEVWDSDCNVCECNAGTRSVVCKPRACTALGYNNCTEPGWAIRNPSDACCPECMRVCLYNGIRYPVSAQVPSMDCSTCECTNEIDDATKFNKITCEKIICNQTCQTGYEYVDQQGACCECRKTNCTFNMSGRVILLQPGETVQDPQNNCTTLHCDSSIGGPIERIQTGWCQYKNPEDCPPAYEFIHREGECCGDCVKTKCVFNMSGTVDVLEPGKVVQDPQNNCTTLHCETTTGEPIERTQSVQCQYNNPEDCQPGYEFIHREGECCGVCEKRRCVFNMSGTVTVLEPGEIVQDPQNNCTTLRCESTTGEPIERTQTVQCQYNNPEDCQLGYEYIHREGECCGECVKTRCVFNMSGIVTVLKPGETVQDPQNNCTTHHCKPTTGEPIEKTQTIQCSPNFNPDNCLPGTIKLDEAKCCKTCYPPPGNCRLFNSSKYIFYDACSSVEPVEVVSCEGSCPTYSMYSEQGNSVNHTCKCCRDMKTRPRSTSFLCSNGTRFDATYTFIEECGCKEFACDRSVRSIADDLGLDYPHRNHLVRKRALRAQANP
ncbi:unnamed protein product [Lampetra planeri]